MMRIVNLFFNVMRLLRTSERQFPNLQLRFCYSVSIRSSDFNADRRYDHVKRLRLAIIRERQKKSRHRRYGTAWLL